MPKDDRVDKFMTWGLSAFSGVALMIGAWFFSGLATEMGKLREAVTELKIQVAVQAGLTDRFEDLDKRVRKLETR